MLRANIYSYGALEENQLKAVREGLDMVASHLGEQITAKTMDAKFPQDDNGDIWPMETWGNYLEKMVELHVAVAPIKRIKNASSKNSCGIALPNQGLACVEYYQFCNDTTRTTTAHETAHALGFVLPKSPQLDPKSGHHCSSNDCLLSHQMPSNGKTLEERRYESPLLERLLRTTKAGERKADKKYKQRGGVVFQEDFCEPCRGDLRSHGADQVARLRTGRMLTKGFFINQVA